MAKESRMRRVSSIAMLSSEELQLINMHMTQNTEIHFTSIFKGWYDENGNLCIQYSDHVWYHYNVERGEWW